MSKRRSEGRKRSPRQRALGATDDGLASDLGPLPEDWAIRSLRELAASDGRYGSSAPARPYDADLPRYIRITDIDDDGALRSRSLASIAAEEAVPFRLSDGDLLFARSGATVGKTYLYDAGDGICAHAGYVIRFPLDRTRCDPAFVARWTRSSFYHRWVRATLRQAAQPNINAGEYGTLPVPIPPLREQRAIARTLVLADRVIRTTDRVVTKLELVLRGLVHELLTRGVTETGRLRDPAVEPEIFVDTPLGPLPRHFRVEPVEALLADVDPAMRSGPFGSALLKSELVHEGIPLLGIDNVHVDRFVPVYRRFVSPSKFHQLRRFVVRPRDVMVTIMGTVGRSCLVPNDIGQALSSKHVWTLTFDPERYLPDLVSLQLNYAHWVHEHFRREEQGGTMAAIRSDTLRNTLLPVPPPQEQRRIMRVLDLCRRRLISERKALDKHRRLRKALIEDLLTGRVRLREP